MRLASTLFAASLAATALAASNCNGNDALCERLYSNVTYVGTHNSYAVGTNAADNQAKDVTGQLVSVCSRDYRNGFGHQVRPTGSAKERVARCSRSRVSDPCAARDGGHGSPSPANPASDLCHVNQTR